MEIFQKTIEFLVPPMDSGTSGEDQRKVRLAVKYSLVVQLGVGIYLFLDTFVLGHSPPWRQYSVIILILNALLLASARIFKLPKFVQNYTPATVVGLVFFGALDNGGIFGPIPSCFALTTMVTIALASHKVSEIYLGICLILIGIFAALAESPFVAKVNSEALTYVMANILMILTTYWFFFLYEKEQTRLRSIEREHHRLQTLANVMTTLNHEINTPLNSVFLALELAKNQNLKVASDVMDLHEHTLDAYVEAERGLRQIQNVLKKISSIKPEMLVEESYRSFAQDTKSAKLYLLDPSQQIDTSPLSDHSTKHLTVLSDREHQNK